MKVGLFQQAPYRFMPDLPADGLESAVTTPYPQIVGSEGMFDSYRWFVDEALFGLRAGFDGVAVTEHGQTSYDMDPNPNLPAAILANAIRTEDLDAAVIVLGRSLGKTREPLRIAEEYAMLDCLSGGRLVAGLPVGLSYDANLNQGIPPVETRGRYREGHDLLMRAWTSETPFAFNGRYSQYAHVNPWPRPLQKPHPPIWVPGSGSPGTMAWTIENDYAFVYLSWFGPTLTANRIFDRFWQVAKDHGEPANPYRVAFVQSVVVAETDEQAAHDYGPYVQAAFNRGPGSVPLHYMGLPGYADITGVEMMIRDPGDFGLAATLSTATFDELSQADSVIAGSPETVRDKLVAFVEKFRIGNLLVQLQMGGMPHDLAMRNIELFAERVLPDLREVWAGEKWAHDWWPTGRGDG
jgi:alkanesulfonate monooxygenase SsuD/methylene tetrahydromethanopterin reductase-like flavin-dependent oxidoreductase (luciferase family)